LRRKGLSWEFEEGGDEQPPESTSRPIFT
jgi:hypothetical protein